MKLIYLDHAAATPLNERVFAAMQPYFGGQFYNPSAAYAGAVQVRRDIDAARARIAPVLGCRPVEVVFTAGGTEANNAAIKGIMDHTLQTYPDAKIAVSAIEHDSVIEAAKSYQYAVLPVNKQGIVDLEELITTIDDNVGLVSVMYANNEIGSIQPIAKIAKILEQIRKDRRTRAKTMPLLFHCDAAQAGNYLDLHVSRLGVDLLTLNGGKIYGPKQSGVLYVRGGTQLKPLIAGGGQERGMRSGTENTPAIIGIAEALEAAQNMRHEESKRLSELQQLWINSCAATLPRAVINGSLKNRLPNNIHLTITGFDNERLLYQLDTAGIMAAAGSACNASHEEPSHVLKAIGLDDGQARSSLRFTMGRQTSHQEIQQTIKILARLTQIDKTPTK